MPGKLRITPGKWPQVLSEEESGVVLLFLSLQHLTLHNLMPGVAYNKVPHGKEKKAKMALSHLFINAWPGAGELSQLCLCHWKAEKSGSLAKIEQNNGDFRENSNSSFLSSAVTSGVRRLEGK